MAAHSIQENTGARPLDFSDASMLLDEARAVVDLIYTVVHSGNLDELRGLTLMIALGTAGEKINEAREIIDSDETQLRSARLIMNSLQTPPGQPL